MNLILCGMMGSGKTTVGKALAQALSYAWVDTDEVIVSRYGDITDIFKEKGEGYFRNLEKETVKQLVPKDRQVISTGGGLVLDGENVSLFKENGKILYLRAKKQTLVKRLEKEEGRPLLQGEQSLDEKITNLLAARAAIYESVADYVIDVDEKTPQEIVIDILAAIGEL